jgi:hypothetical protein
MPSLVSDASPVALPFGSEWPDA